MPGQTTGIDKLFTKKLFAIRYWLFAPHYSLFTETKPPGFASTGTDLRPFHAAFLMNRFRDPYGAEIMIRIFLGYRDPYGVIVI